MGYRLRRTLCKSNIIYIEQLYFIAILFLFKEGDFLNNSNEYANKLYDNKKYKEAIIFYKRNIEYLLNENIENYYKDNNTNLNKNYYNIR